LPERTGWARAGKMVRRALKVCRGGRSSSRSSEEGGITTISSSLGNIAVENGVSPKGSPCLRHALPFGSRIIPPAKTTRPCSHPLLPIRYLDHRVHPPRTAHGKNAALQEVCSINKSYRSIIAVALVVFRREMNRRNRESCSVFPLRER